MIEPIARIRIELQNIEPKIWRRVDVPLSSTLMALHDIIQVTIGWTDSHLFEFLVGDRAYGEPMPEDETFGRKVYQAKSIRLKTLIDRGVERFLYVYDFGDNWRHDVIIDEIRDGDAEIDYPAFVDGARRCPPEDVGSASGFFDFLEAVLDPGHEEHESMVTWYGKPFDPADIDEWRIRMFLAMFAARRRGPLMSHRGNARAVASDTPQEEPLSLDIAERRAHEHFVLQGWVSPTCPTTHVPPEPGQAGLVFALVRFARVRHWGAMSGCRPRFCVSAPVVPGGRNFHSRDYSPETGTSGLSTQS